MTIFFIVSFQEISLPTPLDGVFSKISHPSGNSKFIEKGPPPPGKFQSLLWGEYGINIFRDYTLPWFVILAAFSSCCGNFGVEGNRKSKRWYPIYIIYTINWGSSLYFYRTGHLPLTVLKRFSTSGLSLSLLTVSGLLFQPLSCYRHSQKWGKSIILLAQVQKNAINRVQSQCWELYYCSVVLSHVFVWLHLNVLSRMSAVMF